MSFSRTNIYNIALSNLGVSTPISNYNEKSPYAVIINNYYELARDTVLEAHEWSFANAYKELALSQFKSPDPNFSYAFAYPNDCIAPRAVIDPADRKEKKCIPAIDETTGEKIILTNCNPCILRYTKTVLKEPFFSAAFVNALGHYLAYMSAQSILGSGNKKNTELQDYQIAIRQAIVTDARKTEVHDQDDSDFTDARN
ncbi:MAG: hypothetical protein E7Z87_08180 [Cyanobacteria bacterium SIG26]|nr:hypothetical protein [Cyanobacteria bacterium SIG26]